MAKDIIQLNKQIAEQQEQIEELTKERDKLLEQVNANTILLEQLRGMLEDRTRGFNN